MDSAVFWCDNNANYEPVPCRLSSSFYPRPAVRDAASNLLEAKIGRTVIQTYTILGLEFAMHITFVVTIIASLLICSVAMATDSSRLICRVATVHHFNSDGTTVRWNCGQVELDLSAEARESKDSYCSDVEFDPNDPSRRGRYTSVDVTESKYRRSRTTPSGNSDVQQEIDRMTGRYTQLIKRPDGSRSESAGECSVFKAKL